MLNLVADQVLKVVRISHDDVESLSFYHYSTTNIANDEGIIHLIAVSTMLLSEVSGSLATNFEGVVFRFAVGYPQCTSLWLCNELDS